MASTYSDRLKLELMETGANANTWGNNTNTNLETLDAFNAGYLSNPFQVQQTLHLKQPMLIL